MHPKAIGPVNPAVSDSQSSTLAAGKLLDMEEATSFKLLGQRGLRVTTC